MSTDDRPDLREYPPLIEALTEESELRASPSTNSWHRNHRTIPPPTKNHTWTGCAPSNGRPS